MQISSQGVKLLNFEKNMKLAKDAMDDFEEQSFIIKHGDGRVMFSAPHSVEQTREGKIKFSEPQTGILVEMLHNEFGCPVIRKTAHFNDDANFDAESDYKKALADYIRENGIAFLVDLHQMSPSRDVMINFGTGNWKNISSKSLFNIFLSSFSKNKTGMLQLDEPFGATYIHTVSSTIHRECKIPCLQIEINTRLLSEEYEEYSFELIYRTLGECLLKLKEIYGKG